MRGKSILLVIVLILSMFLSGFTFIDIVGNDGGMTYKVDPPGNKVYYFDEMGNVSNTETDNWVIFTVSEDGKSLSFESQGITISQVSVKAGSKYRLYSDLGAEEEGLVAPLNNGGQLPTISHYSFNTGPIITPWVGSIKVVKSVDDWMNDEPSLSGFMMELWLDGERIEGPTATNALGEVIFSSLSPGNYEVKEDLGEDSYLWSVTIDNQGMVVVSEVNQVNNMFIVNVLNEKIWNGTIRVIKNVVDPDVEVPDLSGFQFEIWQENTKIAGPLSTNQYGEVEFPSLPSGTYEVREILGEASVLWNVSYENNGIVVLDKENDNDDVFEINVTNTKRSEDDPWTGTIRVQKQVNDSGVTNPSLEGFSMELWKDNTRILGPTVTNSQGIVEFNNLEEGLYQVREVQIGGYQIFIPNNGMMEIAEENESNDIFGITVTNTRIYPPIIIFTPPTIIPPVDEPIEEVVIEEEEIPEAPTEIEEEEIIEEEIIQVEEEIEEEPIPLATLPRTGSASPLFAYGLLSLMAGLSLKGKRNKK